MTATVMRERYKGVIRQYDSSRGNLRKDELEESYFPLSQVLETAESREHAERSSGTEFSTTHDLVRVLNSEDEIPLRGEECNTPRKKVDFFYFYIHLSLN